MKSVFRLLKNNEGVTTIEIVLILVVLIALVLIFKNQLTSIIQSVFQRIQSSVNSI